MNFSSSAPAHSGQSRREFLRRCGTAALLGTALASVWGCHTPAGQAEAQKALVGSNIYGWGQYAQREKRKLDVEEVLSALRDSGYDYLETNLAIERPEENLRFAEQCKAKGLQPVSLYAGPAVHETGKASENVGKVLAAAKLCQQAGFRALSFNPAPIGRPKTDEELRTQAAALEELGQGLNALGMKLGVHHHTPEMANHAHEFHYNFRHSRPETVGWCYDVHWIWTGGGMPLDALNEYGSRVVTWHLRQSRNRIWWEDLDSGDIDYAPVAKYAKEHQLARYFTVELALMPGTQITRSVVENHRRSREFVRRVFENCA